MIPATFYLFWYHGLYFNSKSSLELALNYVSLIFTFLVNVGALSGIWSINQCNV